MRGRHIEYLDNGPAEAVIPDPELRMSPLARPMGTLEANKFQNCKTCDVRLDCMANMTARRPFALEECNLTLRTSLQQRVKKPLREKVLEVLQEHPEGMTAGEVAGLVNRSAKQAADAMLSMERRGRVRVDRSQPWRFRFFWVEG